MFEIKISSTKDVRKIVIEFGDDSVSSIDSVEPPTYKEPPSMLDRVVAQHMNEVSDKKYSEKQKKSSEEDVLVSPDIKERPPMVDATFAATEF